MAQRAKVREKPQYNTEMYMARLILKNSGVHFCTLIICIYTLCRLYFLITTMTGGGDVLASLLSVAGLALISAGSICAMFFSRDGGDGYITVLTMSVIGTAVLIGAGVMEIISLKADAETIFQLLLVISALIASVSLLSAAKGTSASTVGCYLLGICGIATLVFSAIALYTAASALGACFASTYEWGFFSTDDVDVNSAQIKWYFANSNVASSAVKSVFYARFIERIAFLVMILSVSVTALKIGPYINQQKRTVEFAQDAGGFSAFDGDDFRSISKKRASENVRNQSYYGIGSLDSGEYDAPEETTPKYKTNEYGDYLDEETGIFYYYDNRTGQYYYLDEKSGEYRYKQEMRKNPSVSSGDVMPWEMESTADDDEDNIYNY